MTVLPSSAMLWVEMRRFYPKGPTRERLVGTAAHRRHADVAYGQRAIELEFGGCRSESEGHVHRNEFIVPPKQPPRDRREPITHCGITHIFPTFVTN